MITDYANRRPQSFIYQHKQVVEDAAVTRDNAFIFGPAIYYATLSADSAGVNYFTTEAGKVNTVDSNTKYIFAGEFDPGTTYTAVTQSGKLIGYKTSSGTALAYAIPNSNYYTANINSVIGNGASLDWQLPGSVVTKKQIDNTTISASIDLSSTMAPDTDVGVLCGTVTTGATANTAFYFEFQSSKNFKADESIIKIASTSDIVSNFGPITKDNTLAFACMLALQEAGKAIYADATGGASAADYQNVISKIENTDLIQFIAPVFGDAQWGASSPVATVQQALLSSIESVSSESKQKWRRAYFGSPYITGKTVGSTTYSTKSDISDAVIAQAIACNSDRFILVWCDNAQYLTDSGTAILGNDFIAAMVAGIRSSKAPQQGLSMQSLSTIAAAPKMYTVWDVDSLDAIAAQGTFIITQDYKNSDIYIRHQLTTDTNNGIMYWEDSVGVNVDEISYSAKDIIKPYIGKRNVTKDTLEEINNKWYATLLEKTNAQTLTSQIGPQIIEIVEGSVTTTVDANFKDRIILTATLVLPLPINTIVVYINAVVSV